MTCQDRNRLLLASALAIVTLAGCGDPYPIAPVSGKITLDGKALNGARVGFEPKSQGNQPNAGPGSYATTDAQGDFRLTTLHGDDGAVIGQHHVWIRTFLAKPTDDGGSRVITKEVLPERYHDESRLTFEVPAAGTTEANFPLTSD